MHRICLWIQEAVCLIFRFDAHGFLWILFQLTQISQESGDDSSHLRMIARVGETDTPSKALRRMFRVVMYAKRDLILLFVGKGS